MTDKTHVRIRTHGICKRCGGSGKLLRPTHPKAQGRIPTIRCTSCSGLAVRWQAKNPRE